MGDLGMDPLALLSLVLAAGWLVAAAAHGRKGANRQAAWCLFVAAGHLLGAAAAPAAPLILLTWLAYGLTFPSGELVSTGRTVLVAAGSFGLGAWSATLFGRDTRPGAAAFVTVAVTVTVVVGGGIALRCRSAPGTSRSAIQWLVGAAVFTVGIDVVLVALHVMAGSPGTLRPWLVAPLLLIPLSQVAAALIDRPRVAETALVESIVAAGLAGLVVAVYLVVVVGLGHAPKGAERSILVSSLVAAVVVAALAQAVRRRLVELASALVDRQGASAEELVTSFGARMSRAVPMDELMLQLTESLRATVGTAGAEIWVGADGVLNRSVSVPALPAARLTLGDRERVVVGRARIGGLSWVSVWLPGLLTPPGADADRRTDARAELRADLRVAPVAHLGELLGLIVIRRQPDSAPLTDDDDRQLVELARQLGLALHNVRLDSALQASLEELEQRNQQLQASRLRIVTAADESRQAIERNLHDGAQQHLVALAVKLGLAEAIVEEDPEMVAGLLQELRSDVQTTIRELRELAHGIYPPLLRDRGLAEALRAASNRSPLDCTVEVELPRRFPQEVETATYFCCLEAMQNAGKHAGANAKLVVRVGIAATEPGTEQLRFEVTDDGAGFDTSGPGGHGFVNMNDRLGAIGGRLAVRTAAGEGTTISGLIPVEAAPSAPSAQPAQPAPAPSPSAPSAPSGSPEPAPRPAAAADAGRLPS